MIDAASVLCFNLLDLIDERSLDILDGIILWLFVASLVQEIVHDYVLRQLWLLHRFKGLLKVLILGTELLSFLNNLHLVLFVFDVLLFVFDYCRALTTFL